MRLLSKKFIASNEIKFLSRQDTTKGWKVGILCQGTWSWVLLTSREQWELTPEHSVVYCAKTQIYAESGKGLILN